MQRKTMPQNRPQPQVHIIAELVVGIGRALALSVEVFLHRGFGPGYVGCGLFVFVLMFFFAMFFPKENTGPLAAFAAMYGIFWLVAVVNVIVRWWRGIQNIHSRYNGRPHLCWLLPRWKEKNVKLLESCLVIALAGGVHHLSRLLGDYLVLASIVMFVRDYSLASMQRMRAVELNDAVIEQKEIAEQFREMQQD
jgi:hypothetical protein